MDLILWRHAEAEDIAPDHTDFGRRLTPKGHKQAAKMAKWLNKHIPDDIRILVSPAVRAQQTAAALGRNLITDARLGTEGTVKDLLAAANWPHAEGTVLVVAHQPTLGQAAAYLMSGLRQDWDIAKGSIWWLTQVHAAPPTQLICVLSSKML